MLPNFLSFYGNSLVFRVFLYTVNDFVTLFSFLLLVAAFGVGRNVWSCIGTGLIQSPSHYPPVQYWLGIYVNW